MILTSYTLAHLALLIQLHQRVTRDVLRVTVVPVARVDQAGDARDTPVDTQGVEVGVGAQTPGEGAASIPEGGGDRAIRSATENRIGNTEHYPGLPT